MQTYVMLSRVSPDAIDAPKDFKKLADDVSERIRKECPNVSWKQSFATMGHYDVIDIIESDNPKEVEHAAMIIRSYGHSNTETLSATPWKEFLASL